MNNKGKERGWWSTREGKKKSNYWHGKLFWVRWKREKKLRRNDGVIFSKLFFTLELFDYAIYVNS
jgi:hypothetical protein